MVRSSSLFCISAVMALAVAAPATATFREVYEGRVHDVQQQSLKFWEEKRKLRDKGILTQSEYEALYRQNKIDERDQNRAYRLEYDSQLHNLNGDFSLIEPDSSFLPDDPTNILRGIYYYQTLFGPDGGINLPLTYGIFDESGNRLIDPNISTVQFSVIYGESGQELSLGSAAYLSGAATLTAHIQGFEPIVLARPFDSLGNRVFHPRDDGDDTAEAISVLFIAFDHAVPEPATWIMLTAGFGFIGAILRKKSRVKSGNSHQISKSLQCN